MPAETDHHPKHRLYAPDSAGAGVFELAPEASHYLCRVLRLGAGDRVLCFDGAGTERVARITRADAKRVELEAEAVTRRAASPRPDATLVQAGLKGDALDRALQRATETGVARIDLVWADRCEVKLSGERLTRKLGHWQRVVASASEQSGRVWVPPVNAPVTLDQWMASSQETDVERIALDSAGEVFEAKPALERAALLVGPEGGFSDAERNRVLPHWQRWKLGHLTLRAETAPAVGLTALFQAAGWPDC